MSARDELIVKYTADLKDKCGVSRHGFIETTR
jgi:hypothetical protein